MSSLTKRLILATGMMFTLNLCALNAYAYEDYDMNTSFSVTTPMEHKKSNKGDDELADQCRELALKINWLGRYQDNPSCTKNLDGTDAYFAGHYLDQDDTKKATNLLENAMVHASFAYEIKCYGQDEIKKTISDIKTLIKAIKDD